MQSKQGGARGVVAVAAVVVDLALERGATRDARACRPLPRPLPLPHPHPHPPSARPGTPLNRRCSKNGVFLGGLPYCPRGWSGGTDDGTAERARAARLTPQRSPPLSIFPQGHGEREHREGDDGHN